MSKLPKIYSIRPKNRHVQYYRQLDTELKKYKFPKNVTEVVYEYHISDLLHSIQEAENLNISISYEGLQFNIDGKNDSITSFNDYTNYTHWEDYSWFVRWFKNNFKNLKKLKKLRYLVNEVDNDFLNNFPKSLKVLEIDSLNDLKEPLFKHLNVIKTWDNNYRDEDKENANLIKKYGNKINEIPTHSVWDEFTHYL
tara:strand:- start:323 stop:910 length:588 start_codon:yes stop_codon:yes gene_type:complete